MGFYLRRHQLAALILLVGVVMSPLGAVAATIPVLLACDATVRLTPPIRVEAGPRLGPTRGNAHEYPYNGVIDEDDAERPDVADRAGSGYEYDGAAH